MNIILSTLAVSASSFAMGIAFATPHVDSSGQVFLDLCGKEGVNESMGVGRNFTKESLGVQCESGEGYRVFVR